MPIVNIVGSAETYEITAEAALRGTVGVWQGCAWRVRFKRCPTCALEILMIASLWDLFDLEGKLKDP